MIIARRTLAVSIIILYGPLLFVPLFPYCASAADPPLVFNEITVTGSVIHKDTTITVVQSINIEASGKLLIENSTLSIGQEGNNSCGISVKTGGELGLVNSTLLILSPYTIDVYGKFTAENSSIIAFGKESPSYLAPQNRNSTNEMEFHSTETNMEYSSLNRVNLTFINSSTVISHSNINNTMVSIKGSSSSILDNNTFISTDNNDRGKVMFEASDYSFNDNRLENATFISVDSNGSIRNNVFFNTIFSARRSDVDIVDNEFVSFPLGEPGIAIDESKFRLTGNDFKDDSHIFKSIELHHCSESDFIQKDNIFTYNSSNIIESERNLVGKNYEYLSVRLINPTNTRIQLEREPFVTWSNHGLGWKYLMVNYIDQSYVVYIPTFEIMENGSFNMIKNTTVHVRYSGKEIQKAVVFRGDRITRLEIRLPGDEKEEPNDGIQAPIIVLSVVIVVIICSISVAFFIKRRKSGKRRTQQ